MVLVVLMKKGRLFSGEHFFWWFAKTGKGFRHPLVGVQFKQDKLL